MLEFENEVKRWHKLREYAEYMAKYTAFRERGAIRECGWYEWDQQSAEEYCYHPKLVTPPLATMCLNGNSEETCWKCPHYEVITGTIESSESTPKGE